MHSLQAFHPNPEMMGIIIRIIEDLMCTITPYNVVIGNILTNVPCDPIT